MGHWVPKTVEEETADRQLENYGPKHLGNTSTNDDIEMNDIEANTDTASASRRTRTSPSTTANLPPPPTPPVTPSRRLRRANLTPRSAKMKSSPNSNASSTGERSTDEFVASTRGDRLFADGFEEAPPFSSAMEMEIHQSSRAPRACTTTHYSRHARER